MLDCSLLILQSFQSCSLQSTASMADFSRIFDPLGGSGLENPPRARRALRVGPRLLHGEAHAILPLAMHACFACMLRAKLYGGTANPGGPAKRQIRSPSHAKTSILPLQVSKTSRAGVVDCPKDQRTGGALGGLGGVLGLLGASLGALGGLRTALGALQDASWSHFG